MHLKVFVKLKKTLKTLSSGPRNPKKPKKTQKNPKNPKTTKNNQKNPLGWVFLKKTGFFPTLCLTGSQFYSLLPDRRPVLLPSVWREVSFPACCLTGSQFSRLLSDQKPVFPANVWLEVSTFAVMSDRKLVLQQLSDQNPVFQPAMWQTIALLPFFGLDHSWTQCISVLLYIHQRANRTKLCIQWAETTVVLCCLYLQWKLWIFLCFRVISTPCDRPYLDDISKTAVILSL